MRKQTSPAGRQLNLSPVYLVTGPDFEGDANKYTSAQFVAAKSVDINPAYTTSLPVIIEGRLTGNQWYIMASPGVIDTIEYECLEGDDRTSVVSGNRVSVRLDLGGGRII